MMLRWTRQLTSDEVTALRALVAVAADVDRVAPLSDDSLLRITPDPLAAGQHLIVADPGSRSGAGEVAGYAHLDTRTADRWQAELVVHPAHRRRGVGRQLLDALVTSTDEHGASLGIWAHGDPAAAAALARSHGFGRERVLWQLRRSLSPLPGVTIPPDVTIRTFVRGRDEDAWVAVNRRAFADHPEQGRWTVDDLLLREAESWFDPAGFFLAESAGRIAGFHWTKVHAAPGTDAVKTGTARVGSGQKDLGEVYVVGVEPAFAGRGLGRTLTLVGLHHLRDRGLDTVMLYVDDSNQRAVRLYERLGFTRHSCDVSYLRTPGSSAGAGRKTQVP